MLPDARCERGADKVVWNTIRAAPVEYGASNYEVSWIYSLFLVCSTWFGETADYLHGRTDIEFTAAFFLFTAPLSTVLSNAFSQRSVVMLGGFFLGLGIALSYFAQSLTFFYISYGCLSGTV